MSEFDGPGHVGSEENRREVAAPVGAALAALKEAGEVFRNRESKLVADSRGMPIQGSAKEAVRLSEEAAELGRLAQMCGGAAADLEAALAGAFQQMATRADRPKPKVIEAFVGFQHGWMARGVADEYLALEEPPEGVPPPACTMDDALALFRAQIAKGVA